MENLSYSPSEEVLKGVAAPADLDIKKLGRAKWLIIADLIINGLCFCIMPLIAAKLFREGYYNYVAYAQSAISWVLWLLASYQLTRMSQKSFRMFGWYLGAYTVYNVLLTLVGNHIISLLGGTELSQFGFPILQVIGFFILFLGILAYNRNEGANYNASAIIVAMNIIMLGLSFTQVFPVAFNGNFAQEVGYFSIILQLGFIWAWWMFFKYTVPCPEDDDTGLSFKALVSNRVFTGVAIAIVFMLMALYIIANLTLKL